MTGRKKLVNNVIRRFEVVDLDADSINGNWTKDCGVVPCACSANSALFESSAGDSPVAEYYKRIKSGTMPWGCHFRPAIAGRG